ncbi:MAG: hypothetical protein IJY78_01675, partial [Bacteroidaceae bacterium]|nr:hypothetical protein [Bacteroidaceae bacterium]
TDFERFSSFCIICFHSSDCFALFFGNVAQCDSDNGAVEIILQGTGNRFPAWRIFRTSRIALFGVC